MPPSAADSISQVSKLVKRAPSIMATLVSYEQLQLRNTVLQLQLTDAEIALTGEKTTSAKHRANADLFAEKLSRALVANTGLQKQLLQNRVIAYTLAATMTTAAYIAIKAKQPEIAGICGVGGVAALIISIKF